MNSLPSFHHSQSRIFPFLKQKYLERNLFFTQFEKNIKDNVNKSYVMENDDFI